MTPDAVIASFVNASHSERSAITLPPGFGHDGPGAPADPGIDWDAIDFLGWRDRRVPAVGYVVIPTDDGPVGIMLRQAGGIPLSRAQCSWCEDVHLPNEVVFFSAKRSGAAGRNGDTVGTLVCAGFECSANVRRRPAMAYVGFDVEGTRLRRIEALRTRVGRFARNIRDGA